MSSVLKTNALESEAIYIFREVISQFDRPVLLFSGGKDSITLVRLAQKAFFPAKIPFPLLHVETRKRPEPKNVFSQFVMILVNGMKKTNVRNCLIC